MKNKTIVIRYLVGEEARRVVVRPDGQVFGERQSRDQLGGLRWTPEGFTLDVIVTALQALADYGLVDGGSPHDVNLYAREGALDCVVVTLALVAPEPVVIPPLPGAQAASELDVEPEETPYESPDAYNADNYGAGGF